MSKEIKRPGQTKLTVVGAPKQPSPALKVEQDKVHPVDAFIAEMKAVADAANNAPTRTELRKSKGLTTNLLSSATGLLDKFTTALVDDAEKDITPVDRLIDTAARKNKLFASVMEFFFDEESIYLPQMEAEEVDEDEVSVPAKPHTSKDGNVVFVDFKRNK